MLPRFLLPAALLPVLLAGCASIDALDRKPRRLEADERVRVEAQVDRALADGKWAPAWNQAIDLGASRARMEDIALRAIEADVGAAEDMTEAIKERWGGLSPDATRKAQTLARAAADEGDWARAVEIEILVAADAPRFLRAWEMYDLAPPSKAPDLLELITKAKDEAGESGD